MTATMHSQRNWVAGGTIGAVAIAAMSWFFLISPERSDTSSLNSQTADVQLSNDMLTHKVSDLRKQDDHIAELRQQLATRSAELPAGADVQDYTRQLVSQAALAHVTLSSIVAGSPSIANAGGTTSAAGTTVSAAGKLFAIPISVTSTGTLEANRSLIRAIQKVGPRRALVTSAQFAPAGGGKVQNIDTVSAMTLQVQIFVAPQIPADEKELLNQINGK